MYEVVNGKNIINKIKNSIYWNVEENLRINE